MLPYGEESFVNGGKGCGLGVVCRSKVSVSVGGVFVRKSQTTTYVPMYTAMVYFVILPVYVVLAIRPNAAYPGAWLPARC
jgi:hypothetical protein